MVHKWSLHSDHYVNSAETSLYFILVLFSMATVSRVFRPFGKVTRARQKLVNCSIIFANVWHVYIMCTTQCIQYPTEIVFTSGMPTGDQLLSFSIYKMSVFLHE